MYKLVVLDVDDTIVTMEKSISAATIEAIKKAQSRGVQVTLASGRMHQAMLSTAKKLDIKLPLISCNGAMIRAEEQVLSCDMLDKNIAKEVIEFFENKNKVLQLYTKEGVYSKEKCERTWMLEQGEGVPCNVIEPAVYNDFYQNDLLKLLIRLKKDEVSFYRENVEAAFGSKVSAAVSHNVYFEITNKGVNKGKAVAWLAQKLGFERDEVVAIGDSHNDQKMLEWAGLGIAMGNASTEAKEAADKITLPIDQDGVAAALYEYVL